METTNLSPASIVAIHLLVAVLATTGCAAQPAKVQPMAVNGPSASENSVSSLRTTSVEQPSISVRYEPVARVAALPRIDDLYLRLIAVPPSDADLTLVTFDQKSITEKLLKAAKQLIYKKDEVVLAAVSGKIAGQDFGKRSLMLVNPTDASNPTYSDHYLTPYFRTSDSLEVQWITGDSIKTKQNAVSALVLTLGALSAVYAPQGVLFKALANTSNLSEKTKAVDAELDKVFSSEELRLKPLQTIEASKIDRFDVYFNEKKMVAVRIDFRESLISPDGKAALLPNRSAEILGKRIEGGGLVADVLTKHPDVMSALNKNTGAGFADFCRFGAIALTGAGFNVVDRSAILYAYLVDSQWNTAAAMRSTPDCEREIGYGANGTSLSFKSTADLVAFRDSERLKAIALMQAKKIGIWDKLSGKLGKPTADVWEAITDDSIVLTTVKHDLGLAGGDSLKAGIPQTLSREDARDIFVQAQLKFDKARALSDGSIEDSCYSVQDTPTSSFRAYCFYPKTGNKPLFMEFDFVAPFSADEPTPKLKSIKFLPSHAGMSL